MSRDFLRSATLGVVLALAAPSVLSAQEAVRPQGTPFMGYRIDHHAIGVKDFDAVSRWYVEKLDFRVEKTWTVRELPGARLGYLVGPGGYRIEIVEGGRGPRAPSGSDFARHFDVLGYNHVSFAVEDVDATAAELRRRGVPLFFAVTDFPQGAERRLFFIKDPEGNVIEFTGPLTRTRPVPEPR